jgi:hypothetical protein
MRSKRGPLGLLVLTAAFLVFAFGATSAQADFGIANWEALTCEENEETPTLGGTIVGTPEEIEESKSAGQCTEDTEGKWFTQATGHPPFGITDFTLNTTGGFPDGFVKDIVVDIPEGLGVNPEANVKCPLAQAETAITTCPPQSIVGINYLTVVASSGPPLLQARSASPVYNIEPFDGVPSMVAFPDAAGEAVFIVGDLDPKDQHVQFTISDTHFPEAPSHPAIVGSRLVFYGQKNPLGFGNGTYLTMPSNCAGGQTSLLYVNSHSGAEDNASFTTAVGADECASAPFNVQVETEASGGTGSPGPASVDVQMPDQLTPETRADSHLLKAEVELPEGTGLNPSVVNGLAVCTDAQFKKGTDQEIECPDASRIGSIEVETKALDQDLGGDVYVAQPLSNNPSSGNQFRVFLHAFNERYGVNVRLIGNVFPNPQTGQLTAVVDNNPQAPFNSFKVTIDGGPRGALTTPGTCGPHTTTATYTPWADNGNVTDTSSFELTKAGYGGDCPDTLAERRFAPGFRALPQDNKAGAFAPFRVNLTRVDGEQEVKRIDVDLAPGMVARLRGLEYCPQVNIDAAGARSGASTTASPPCPASSWVGSVVVAVGSGPAPYKTPGNIYLAGPYKGAPVSLVFITPAVAGPYDLGTTVVRAALYIAPETAEVRAVSDPIPDVFGGVKLSIKGLAAGHIRPKFAVNPTSCREPLAVRSRIWGGGGNPANPAQWQAAHQQNEYRGRACKRLGFKPKFFARIFGGKNQTRRARNPKFRAIFDARKGDANLRRAAFILPRATILDQSHIRTICTRVQLAAKQCPKAAIYGHAKANSPLLDKPLKGPVYLTSSDNELPDLLVDLRGQVNIHLRGVISSKNARLKTVFRKTPDVPVNKFVLTMKGGNRGLLVNSRNLCQSRTSGFLNLLAQNSRRERNKNLRLNIPACRK